MSDGMQSFQWSGIDRQGRRISGVLSAADSKDVHSELKKRDIEVVSIEQKKKLNISFTRKKEVKSKDILLFTRYLSTMMAAGLPIIQAIDVIARDQDNEALQEFLTSLRSNIASGKTLAESFSEYPQYFNGLYCNLIKAGEKSGTLDKILARLATYLEKTEALKRKVKKALTYPIAILTVALGVSLILLLYVIPHFQMIFDSFGAKLPAFTLMVIHLSHFVKSYWWLILLAVIAMWMQFKVAFRTNDKFRERVDSFSLRLYIIGPMLKKSIIARFTRTLAITLEAGMPIVDSMKSMSEIMGNTVFSKAILKICDDLISGNQLYVSMSKTKLFPNMAVQMISIGEASGTLSEMLNKVADYYEDEVNHIVDNLSSLLEPLIMVVLGVIVGGFVIAMYLPIFKLGSLF